MADQERVCIRSYPKIVYLYPTLIAALFAGILSWVSLHAAHGDLNLMSQGPGRAFTAVFIFNLLVLAFDFSRKGFMAVCLTTLLVLALGLLLETKVPVFGWVEHFFGLFDLRAHPHVYLAIAFTLLVLIGAVVFMGRFDFWEIRPNEILHYQGFMADVERFPAPGLRFKKTIPDVFEYVLLRAGTIVLMPAVGEKQEIQNVPNVNFIEKRLERLLGSIQIQVQPAPPQQPPTPPAVNMPIG